MITTKTDQSGSVVMIRGKEQLNCPYQPALAIPGQLSGQIQIIRMPCNSSCPMFEQRADAIHLNCTGTVLKKAALDIP